MAFRRMGHSPCRTARERSRNSPALASEREQPKGAFPGAFPAISMGCGAISGQTCGRRRMRRVSGLVLDSSLVAGEGPRGESRQRLDEVISRSETGFWRSSQLADSGICETASGRALAIVRCP